MSMKKIVDLDQWARLQRHGIDEWKSEPTMADLIEWILELPGGPMKLVERVKAVGDCFYNHEPLDMLIDVALEEAKLLKERKGWNHAFEDCTLCGECGMGQIKEESDAGN